MKTKFYVPLLLVLLVSISAVYAGDDKAAITEVIENEQKAYVDKDMEAWSGYWIQEPYVHAIWFGAQGYEQKISYDSLKASVEKWMASEKEPGPVREKKILDIHVDDDMATVFLKEIEPWKFAGMEKKIKYKSTYVLKKVKGDWKFISMTTYNKSSYQNNDFVAEWNLNMQGYRYLWKDDIDKAIKVFELNTQLYPNAFNTWDSLAEAYMKKGDNKTAISYYKISLLLNPDNENAQKMIDKMGKE